MDAYLDADYDVVAFHLYRQLQHLLVAMHQSITVHLVLLYIDLGAISLQLWGYFDVEELPRAGGVSPEQVEGKPVADTKTFVGQNPLYFFYTLGCQHGSGYEGSGWNLKTGVYKQT